MVTQQPLNSTRQDPHAGHVFVSSTLEILKQVSKSVIRIDSAPETLNVDALRSVWGIRPASSRVLRAASFWAFGECRARTNSICRPVTAFTSMDSAA